MASERPLSNHRVLTLTMLVGLAGASILAVSSHGPDTERDRGAFQGDFPTTVDTTAFETGLWSDPWAHAPASSDPPPKGSSNKGPTVSEILQDVLANANDQAAPSRLLVLPVIVSGQNDKIAQQERSKRRHAVELALSASGYSMKYPERMTYKWVNVPFYMSPNEETPARFSIPIKLYRRASSETFAFVVWIKEDFLGARPLHAIAAILEEVLKDGLGDLKQRSALAVIGPEYSEQLQAMLGEFHDGRALNVAEGTRKFYRGWAHGTLIANAMCTSPGLDKTEAIQLDESTQIPVRHFIGSDDRLTQLLADEMSRRGIEGSNIALFVEQGPHEYIDGLLETFAEVLGEAPVVLPYLKGVGSDEPTEDNLSDYLERTLGQWKRQLGRDRDAYSVHAVGVFGSAWQDKTAIIRAAREVFPVATFFTTELDHRYSQPEHYQVLRNVIVASHYGYGVVGQLNDVRFDALPSFRDGYQTSVLVATVTVLHALEQGHLRPPPEGLHYFAPQNAFDQQDLFHLWSLTEHGKEHQSQALKPLLFEVGRRGPVQLVDDELPEHFPIRQPDGDRLSLRRHIPELVVALIGFGLAAVVLVEYFGSLRTLRVELKEARSHLGAVGKKVFHFASGNEQKMRDGSVGAQTTMNAIWILCLFTCVIGVLLLAVVNDWSLQGEPVSLFDSISIWPSVGMLIIVGFISSKRVIDLYPSDKSASRSWFLDGARLAVVLLVTVLICLLITKGFGIPPARSTSARWLGRGSQLFAGASLLFLACLCAVQILHARRRIVGSMDNRAQAADLSAGYQELISAMKEGSRSSQELLLPALLAVVYALARLPLLDSWQMHPVSYVVLLIPLVFSLIAGFLMRLKARSFKIESLQAVDAQIALKLQKPDHNMDSALRVLEKRRELYDALDQGPFGSLASDPLLGGVVLVFTAVLAGPVGDASLLFWMVDFLGM